MKVTKVSVQKEEKENSRVKGYAVIELDGVLKINGIGRFPLHKSKIIFVFGFNVTKLGNNTESKLKLK